MVDASQAPTKCRWLAPDYTSRSSHSHNRSYERRSSWLVWKEGTGNRSKSQERMRRSKGRGKGMRPDKKGSRHQTNPCKGERKCREMGKQMLFRAKSGSLLDESQRVRGGEWVWCLGRRDSTCEPGQKRTKKNRENAGHTDNLGTEEENATGPED